MADEILNILKQECLRPLGINDPSYVEEESPLGFVRKPRRTSEAVLLGNTRYRERLAWKTRK